MAYDRKKIFEQAKQEIVNRKLFFIEDLVAFLPCNKTTFYEIFPIGSNESNELKELIDIQKTEVKSAMRKKWFASDNATLQMGLMKLICTDEERKKLAMQYTENELKIEYDGFLNDIKPPID